MSDKISEWVGKTVSTCLTMGYEVRGIVLAIDEDEVRGYVDWYEEGQNMCTWEYLSDLDIVEDDDITSKDIRKYVLDSILEKLKVKGAYISFMKPSYDTSFCYHINTKDGGFQAISREDYQFLSENKLIRSISDITDNVWLFRITYKGLNYKWD